MPVVWRKGLISSTVFASIVSALSTIVTAMVIMYIAMYPGPKALQVPIGDAFNQTAKIGTFRSTLPFEKSSDGTWTGHNPWWFGPNRHQSLRFKRLVITAVGWPFPCMYGGSAIGSLDSYDGSGFYSFGYLRMSSTRYQKNFGGTIPTRIAINGFVTNVTVFTVPLLVLIHSGRVAVRLRRLRQGRCPQCGYPLDDAKRCPECGAGHPTP